MKFRQSPRILIQQNSHLGRGRREKKKAQAFSPTATTISLPKRIRRTDSERREKTKWEKFESRIARQVCVYYLIMSIAD